MSTASKVTLGLACAFACGMFAYVNGKQWFDKKKMLASVSKDIERQELRKMENLYWLEKQIEITQILKERQYEDEKIALSLLESPKEE